MRPQDWPARLQEYVEQVRSRPFDPVSHNCALFAAGAIAAITGRDPVSELDITLTSEADVEAVLKAHGGVRGLAVEYLGDIQPRLRARRGDVVIKPGEQGETLGICMGDHALFLGPDGLQARQLSECEGCWRVE